MNTRTISPTPVNHGLKNIQPSGPTRLDVNAPPIRGPVRVNPVGPATSISTNPPPPLVRVEQTPTDDQGQVLGSEWERIDLPSNFAPYEWSDISIRRFGVMDHAKIARATRHKNITLLLDVLASNSNRDVRGLVFNDLQALMIWHKLHSYVNTPYNITWNSKYGPRGSVSASSTIPRETKLDKTRAQYMEYKAKGFALPTARDVEVFDSISEDKEDVIFLFDRAQWLDPTPLQERIAVLEKEGDRAASVTARIEELNRRGIKFFPEIEAFAEDFNGFGVKEFVKVTLDAKLFKPADAMVALRADKTPEAIAALRASGKDDDAKEADKFEADLAEANEIQAMLEAGTADKYAPKFEEVPLSFNLWSMFPYI